MWVRPETASGGGSGSDDAAGRFSYVHHKKSEGVCFLGRLYWLLNKSRWNSASFVEFIGMLVSGGPSILGFRQWNADLFQGMDIKGVDMKGKDNKGLESPISKKYISTEIPNLEKNNQFERKISGVNRKTKNKNKPRR